MTQPSALPFVAAEASRRGFATSTLFDLNSLDTWGRIIAAYDAPSQTTHAERVFLYGLVLAQKPERLLEIGFRFGGTAFLMMSALEDIGAGRLVSIDPAPESVLDFSRFGDRFRLLRGESPADVAGAVEWLAGPIDFCFLDGDHSYTAVLEDLRAIAPHMSDESYILLHDAAHPDVQRATDAFVAEHSVRIIDCGLLCPYVSEDRWSGLRLLRVTHTGAAAESRPLVRRRRRWPWSRD